MRYIPKFSKFPEALSYNGYWVKGDTIYETSQDTHINFIIENADKFGLERSWINDLFEQNNERVGSEGKTRELLIKYVSEQGWVRVRHYQKPQDYWSIQCDVLSRRRKDIKNFVLWAIENGVMRKDDKLIVLGYNDVDKEVYEWKDGGASVFLISEKKKKKVK